VIGVHTPEFSFEHNVDNVHLAVQDRRLDYPIAIDNDYAVWDAFANHYWPALYFVDAMGRIRHHVFGEGGYDDSERIIQQLLTQAGAADVGTDLVIPDARGAEVPADWDNLKSPENYLGSGRGSGRVSSTAAQLRLNQWMLTGNWTVESEAIRLQEPNGRLAYQFHARDLHLVMGPTTPGTSIPFRVLLDGLPPGSAHGFDVDEQGNGTLDQQRLYQLIRQPLPVDDRKFEVEFAGAGASAYAFTFG